MTEQQILEKALFKANSKNHLSILFGNIQIAKEVRNGTYAWIIFDHQFAKAFWGEKQVRNNGLLISTQPAWQYHLQQLVLCEEPLKYLEKFL